MERLEIWSQKTLRPTDVVVLEAMSNTWDLYDQLSPLVAAVVVANPARVALIAKSRVKTDPADALALARLLAAGMLPTVWVPPVEVRELRGLTAHRQRWCGNARRSVIACGRCYCGTTSWLQAATSLLQRTATGGLSYRSRGPSNSAFARTWLCSTRSAP